MRFLLVEDIIRIHEQVVARSGGSLGILNQAALESAMAQPQQSFSGIDLYEGLVDKAAALAFFLALNHPFIDGNKRVAYTAMEVFLVLNGYEVVASVDDSESTFLDLAAGRLTRQQLTEWLRQRISPYR
ncbi:type II toxin-antitoxin system death-on-curing family toxin [Limnothrix redekei]|uniref:Type II toxin-antitoxin system death-on-curing family toxin n=1 Tax=Limnothrix redekei LRLZ20PSL1 TaxID=3112953 RepID=A0ABW7C9V8_9CYAN